MTRDEKASALFAGVGANTDTKQQPASSIPVDDEPLMLPPLASDEQALLDDDVPYYLRGRAVRVVLRCRAAHGSHAGAVVCDERVHSVADRNWILDWKRT